MAGFNRHSSFWYCPYHPRHTTMNLFQRLIDLLIKKDSSDPRRERLLKKLEANPEGTAEEILNSVGSQTGPISLKKKKPSTTGFTLMELLIVIVIIAIVGSIFYSFIPGLNEPSTEQQMFEYIQKLESQNQELQAQNKVCRDLLPTITPTQPHAK